MAHNKDDPATANNSQPDADGIGKINSEAWHPLTLLALNLCNHELLQLRHQNATIAKCIGCLLGEWRLNGLTSGCSPLLLTVESKAKPPGL